MQVVALAAVLATATAVAEPPPPFSAGRTYFAGEKASGGAWLSFGVAGLGLGGGILDLDDGRAKGAAIPLLTLGAAHAAFGITMLAVSDGRAEALDTAFAADPVRAVRDELERMQRVDRLFLTIEIVELICIVGGVAMAIAGGATDRPMLEGAGLGLSLEAAATLAIDLFAAARASRYLEALEDQARRLGPPKPVTLRWSTPF